MTYEKCTTVNGNQDIGPALWLGQQVFHLSHSLLTDLKAVSLVTGAPLDKRMLSLAATDPVPMSWYPSPHQRLTR